MLAGFSICHTSMWLLTNRTDASIQWVERAFATDPASYYQTSLSNEATLATAFSANNLDALALKWHKKAYSTHRNDPRSGYNYADELLKQGKKNNEAYAILLQNVIDFPGYVLSYQPLLEHFLEIRNYDGCEQLLVQLEQVYEQQPELLTKRWPQEQIDSYFGALADLRRLRAAKQ